MANPPPTHYDQLPDHGLGFVHSDACIRAQIVYHIDLAAYRTAWPRHCFDCRGWGGHAYRENVGERGLAVMIDGVDPCPSCVEMGLCPRCGTPAPAGAYPDEHPCPTCGYSLATPAGEPTEPECSCWEEAYARRRQ